MNKRIKKKREWLDLLKLVAQLQKANDLQQEVIEDYGNQLAEAKRELALLGNRVNANALASNNRIDQLEAENKALRIDLDKANLEFNKPKRALFGRK